MFFELVRMLQIQPQPPISLQELQRLRRGLKFGGGATIFKGAPQRLCLFKSYTSTPPDTELERPPDKKATHWQG